MLVSGCNIELFSGNIIKFVELFLVDGPSEVHGVGRDWEGNLVKRSIATLSKEKRI